jgi:murein DD-endopeptidase MepM/ murein hydrolase activator NlpD
VSDTASLEDPPAVQYRHVLGRHRARTPAAAPILGSRARSVVLAAAVVAGVGVAGAAAAGTSQARTDEMVRTPTAVHTDLDSIPAVEELGPEPDVTPGRAPTVSFARVLRKERPKPVARWVNPLPEASVTSCFGLRWGRLHAGVDMAAPDGTPIRAAGAGVVVAAGPAEGYGNAVLIDHGNGFLTHYGHMSAITVTVGQKLTAGQQIGNEGSTGHSTGPHLHFEVHAGHYKNPIEPTQWMHEHGVDIAGCVTFTD